MNAVSIRLLSQHLYAPIFNNPEDVVSHLCAIQAQEYRLMRWAVGMRLKRPSSKSFQEAFDKGRIIRLHLLRGTWQLVSAEDYWWLLQLFSDRGRRVIQGWMSANRISITDEEYDYVRKIIIEFVREKASVTGDDINKMLIDKGVIMDKHRLSYHIRMAELSGILCSGSLHPMKSTYSLAEQKIPRTEKIEHDEALERLARKYYTSRSPATLEDFVWWSGLNIGECKKALGLIKGEIQKEKHKGREFYMHDKARVRGFKKGKTLLLPSYDEYLIGYKSRDVVLPEEFRHRGHNNSGLFYPVVVKDGVICGNWKPFNDSLTVEPFDDDDFPRIDEEWKRYESFRRK